MVTCFESRGADKDVITNSNELHKGNGTFMNIWLETDKVMAMSHMNIDNVEWSMAVLVNRFDYTKKQDAIENERENRKIS